MNKFNDSGAYQGKENIDVNQSTVLDLESLPRLKELYELYKKIAIEKLSSDLIITHGKD